MSNLPTQQPKPKSTLKIVLIVCGVMFLGGILLIGGISVLAALTLPVLGRAREAARRVSSASNLSQMGKAMILYADQDENKGEGPSDPTKLFPNFINDPRVFKRPGYPENQDVHYMLVVGPIQEDSQCISAFENPPPGQERVGRNVLFASGAVEWMTDADYKEALAKTEEHLKENKRPFEVVPISRASFNR